MAVPPTDVNITNVGKRKSHSSRGYMSVDSYKSIVKEVARPNRFMVQVLPNPSVFESVGQDHLLADAANIIQGARFLLGNPLSLFTLVKQITLPERTLGLLEHKRMGATRKVAGDPTYNELSVTFLNDTSYSIRSLMDAWHENIVHQSSNYRQVANKYAEGSTILVEKLGLKGIPFAIYKYNDVWPKSIEASELSMDLNDTLSEFTVTFAFNTWTRII